ncbi:NAD-dependent epimerase/dehydratase family protein [Streptosporangium canum]|uniref:NAD-dependent epimerase/dehydratase family protein n=1 Tax=Streptosporangium canum TaxID=324952 RepID=UPI0036AAEC9A
MSGVQGVERAVVTGVAGFIGSHLAEALMLQGVNVVGIDRRSPSCDPMAAGNLENVLGRRGFQLVEGDLGELDLGPLTEGASVVFHLAGVPGVRPSWGERFGDYLASNVMATQRLLEACVSTGVPRMVLASSSSVYGNSVGRPSREEDLPFPLSPYGVTKLAAERLSLSYAVRQDTPLSVVALRYFTVYGPRQRPDMAIGRVLRSVLTGHPLRLYGDGVQRRDFTYVGDAVAATMAASLAPAQAEVVNIGGGRSVSMLDVLACAAQVTGREVPVLRDARQLGDVDATEADLTRARDLLGYEPSTPLAEGMSQQWKWISS